MNDQRHLILIVLMLLGGCAGHPTPGSLPLSHADDATLKQIGVDASIRHLFAQFESLEDLQLALDRDLNADIEDNAHRIRFEYLGRSEGYEFFWNPGAIYKPVWFIEAEPLAFMSHRGVMASMGRQKYCDRIWPFEPRPAVNLHVPWPEILVWADERWPGRNYASMLRNRQ